MRFWRRRPVRVTGDTPKHFKRGLWVSPKHAVTLVDRDGNPTEFARRKAAARRAK